MSSIVKIIMHGLASGRVRSTPQILKILKELRAAESNPVPGTSGHNKMSSSGIASSSHRRKQSGPHRNQ
jgi:hypothetical protein